MLKQRIVTALVLVPLLVGALYGLPASGISLMFAVIIAVAAWEWGGLAGYDRSMRFLYAAALLALGSVPVALLLTQADQSWVCWPFFAALLFWLWALTAMVRDRGQAQSGRGLYGSRVGKLLSGVAVLVPAWMAAVFLVVSDGQRPALLLYALLLVWSADTFAYFSGHAWGRHKLAPGVSPGKTVEGVVGGFAGAMIVATVAGVWVWQRSGGALPAWLTLSAITVLVSVLGDLVESKFKRLAGVKDSGSILPGHGGVLDRIDALTSALPVFALGWFYLQRNVA